MGTFKEEKPCGTVLIHLNNVYSSAATLNTIEEVDKLFRYPITRPLSLETPERVENTAETAIVWVPKIRPGKNHTIIGEHIQ